MKLRFELLLHSNVLLIFFRFYLLHDNVKIGKSLTIIKDFRLLIVLVS